MAENSIHSILAQFREEERHNRHLGDHFERLICRFLELDPIFVDLSQQETPSPRFWSTRGRGFAVGLKDPRPGYG